MLLDSFLPPEGSLGTPISASPEKTPSWAGEKPGPKKRTRRKSAPVHARYLLLVGSERVKDRGKTGHLEIQP